MEDIKPSITILISLNTNGLPWYPELPASFSLFWHPRWHVDVAYRETCVGSDLDTFPIGFGFFASLRLKIFSHSRHANSIICSDSSYMPPFSTLHNLDKLISQWCEVLSTTLQIFCSLADSLKKRRCKRPMLQLNYAV